MNLHRSIEVIMSHLVFSWIHFSDLAFFLLESAWQFYNSHILPETSGLSFLCLWNLPFLAFYKSILLLVHRPKLPGFCKMRPRHIYGGFWWESMLQSTHCTEQILTGSSCSLVTFKHPTPKPRQLWLKFCWNCNISVDCVFGNDFCLHKCCRFFFLTVSSFHLTSQISFFLLQLYYRQLKSSPKLIKARRLKTMRVRWLDICMKHDDHVKIDLKERTGVLILL